MDVAADWTFCWRDDRRDDVWRSRAARTADGQPRISDPSLGFRDRALARG